MGENEEFLDDDRNVYLGFINLIGEESDGYYRYEFIFSDNIEEFWGESFEYSPCCLVNDLKPYDAYITEVHTVKMKVKLSLIQNNCCFGFQDCVDGIVALGYEDISDYEEYPEEGRLYFMFGETMEEVERKLSVKNVIMLN